jgi:hypothetical protein
MLIARTVRMIKELKPLGCRAEGGPALAGHRHPSAARAKAPSVIRAVSFHEN